jgi:hypothetical protein
VRPVAGEELEVVAQLAGAALDVMRRSHRGGLNGVDHLLGFLEARLELLPFLLQVHAGEVQLHADLVAQAPQHHANVFDVLRHLLAAGLGLHGANSLWGLGPGV